MRALKNIWIDERTIAGVIILNSAVLFLLSFDEVTGGFKYSLEMLDLLLLIFFIGEAWIKIVKLGWRSYLKSAWNRFDFLILLLTLPGLISILDPESTKISFLYLFRLARLARFFKFLSFVPNIQEIIAGVKRAFKASIFVLIGFFLYAFVIAMLTCRMFKEAAPEYFGNPLISMYNIFKIFTIEGWYEIPDQLCEEFDFGMIGGALIRLYFVLVVITGGLFGLSIVNAIFVEEMMRDNNDPMEAKIEHIQRQVAEIHALLQTRKDDRDAI